MYTYIQTHTHIYIYIYSCIHVYIHIYSCIHTHIYIHMHASSCRPASMDLPDPLLPPISIIHHSQEVLQATSFIGTELLYIGSHWLSYLCSSMQRGPQEYIAYDFILSSPAVFHMAGLSNLDSFHESELF